MHFQFGLWNHSKDGQRSLEDPISIIGHQLMALGHTVGWDPVNTSQVVSGPDRYNVIVEGFTDSIISAVKEAYDKGAKWIILATEEPTDKGFNHGSDLEMIKRQKSFPDAAKYCEGIWHLVPGERVGNWYRQFAPTSYVELGYATTLIRAPDFIEPKFDFGFFGSMSKRRNKILRTLARSMPGHELAVKIEATFASQADRDRKMRQAKVIVQLRKTEAMGLVSSSRCNTALNIGRPVVAEPHDLSHPWDKIVKFSSSLDAFYNDCLMARSAWKGAHRSQMEKFRELLTPEFCVGRALREIGLEQKVAA